VASTAAFWPTSGRADATRLELAWNAPASCPSRNDVMSAIEQLLGQRTAVEPVAVRGDVSQTAGTWTVDLRWRTRGGEEQRRLQAESCAELARATALVVAFAIAPRTDVAAAVESEPPVAAQPLPATPPAKPPAARQRVAAAQSPAPPST